jgi:hypothetical protein
MAIKEFTANRNIFMTVGDGREMDYHHHCDSGYNLYAGHLQLCT